MKIVIFGLARSGTTALFYKIKNSLPADTVCLFEPQAFDPRVWRTKRISSVLRRREPNVLAKVLPFRPDHPAAVDSFAHFEKHVLIVRDPRDQIVSRLLYGLHAADFSDDDESVTAFLRLLQQKENDPGSVSLKRLLATFADLNGEDSSFAAWATRYQCHSIRKPLKFIAERPSLFLFKYEEMINQQWEKLEEYLGIQLVGEPRIDPELGRVSRTRNYGGWRDWFTAEDVEHLRPILQPFIERHYPEADWRLNPTPAIPAAHCSLYLERIVNDRRRSLNLPLFVYQSGAG